MNCLLALKTHASTISLLPLPINENNKEYWEPGDETTWEKLQVVCILVLVC